MTQAAFYRSLLREDPSLPSVHADLAQTLLMENDLDGAAEECSAALALEPSLLRAWLVRAAARKAQCDYRSAVRDLEQAAALAPDQPAVLVNLANTYAEIGRLVDAERILCRAVAQSPGYAKAHANLGSVLVRLERLAEAEAPCRAALALDPSLIGSHQNLAGILAHSDAAAADRHREVAYGQQQIYITPAPQPERTLLVLAAEAGNVPLQHLIPRVTTTEVRWFIEHATEAQDAALPPADLVFNAIGDPDVAPALKPPVTRLLARYRGRVLNHPDTVARTGRAELAALLAGVPDIVVPATIRDEPDGNGPTVPMNLPVLVRPLGSHGGAGLWRCDDPAALGGLLPGPVYLTEFLDYISPDGWYRKYRAIFVDGRAYFYHLAIARHWLVHYWTAGMSEDPSRRAEEQRALVDPEAAVGARAMAALDTIARRLGLDYGGIDFGLLPDRRMLVFEANATMLVHPEHDPMFAYRNQAVAAIQSAFAAMLADRARPPMTAGGIRATNAF